jgi:hypothetical protein
LKTQTKISVTQGNAVSLWFLAKEFSLSDLNAECATFAVSVDQYSVLSERVSELERHISSFSNSRHQIDDEIQSQKASLHTLRLAFEELQTSLPGELSQLKSISEQPPTSTRSASLKPAKSQGRVEIWLRAPRVVDGIISHLTRKHGGNVHEKGIVNITSKSTRTDTRCPWRSIADFTSFGFFCSNDEPGQWVCWDFREMRVRPTHYTIAALSLKSWVLEGSVDGRSWTEIDRRTDTQDFNPRPVNPAFSCASMVVTPPKTPSFAVAKPGEFCFIRLAQTGRSHSGDDALYLRFVEFFGTLFE